MNYNNRFTLLRNKLFSREREFKNFSNITLEDLDKIKSEATTFARSYDKPYSLTSYDKTSLYEKVLSRITYYSFNPYYREFDKKILYVIFSLDPDLLMYKLYLATYIPDSKPNDEESLKAHNDAVSKYRQELVKLIGFTDPNILKYEEILFNTFYRKEKLVKGVNLNKVNSFLSFTPFVTSFNTITKERFTELTAIAQKWLDENTSSDYHTTLRTAIYNIMYQHQLLGLKTPEEQYCLFILIIDPELETLKIYEEESLLPNIITRLKERFNFYTKDFIRLEKIYHERFCPDLEVNPWTM